MNLRLKLWLGTGLLYVLTLTVVGLSLRSVQRLTASGTRVLRENYNTLLYMQRLDSLLVISELQPTLDAAQTQAIAKIVAQQSANITEPGEEAATAQLRQAVAVYETASPEERRPSAGRVRRALSQIQRINLQAQARKSAQAEQIGEDALREAVMLATIVLLVVFTLAVNFPNVFIRPLERLTRAVRQVGEGSYGTQVEISDPNDELGRLGQAFNAMSSELARYQASNLEQILQAQRRTESIINRLHEPLIVSDAGFRVLFFNEAARHVLGIDQRTLAGSDLTDLARRNELLTTWMHRLEEPAPQPLSIVLEGKERFFTLDAFGIGEAESLLGYVFSMSDVTRFKELDKARADFLATVAHELKTPISTINLSTRLLSSGKPGPLSEGQSPLVAGIAAEAGRLLTLVNSLLELSRTEVAAQVHGLGASSSSQTLNGLLSSLQEKYAALAAEKQVRLETEPLAEDVGLKADAYKVELILSNLVSNAIRYAPAGNGVVRLTVERDAKATRISVTDNGPGIAEEDQPRIFDQFYKGSQGGTGLGLYIARELAGQVGGRILLEAVEGLGARFVMELQA